MFRAAQRVSLVLLCWCCAEVAVASEECSTVEVAGVDGAILENIRARLGLCSASHGELENTSIRSRLIKAADGEVASAVEPFGYYRPTHRIEFDSGGIPERIVVELGPATKITKIALSFEDPELDRKLEQKLTSKLGLEIDQIFDHSAYEDGKRRVQSVLYDRGHLQATLTQNRVLVDRRLGTAEVELSWQVGPLFFFGSVDFLDSPFGDRFMQRYVHMQPGDKFTRRSLARFTKKLLESPYFLTVEVIPRVDQADLRHRVPIQVRIVPMPLNLFEVGISSGSDSGFGLEGTYERRWLNLRGHYFRTQLAPAVDRSQFVATYSIPSLKNLTHLYAFGIDALDETTDTSDKENIAYSFVQQRMWRKWRQTSSLRYLDEDFIAGGTAGSAQLLLLQGTFSTSRPRKELVPQAGWAIDAGFKIAFESFASDTDLVQFDLTTKRVRSLGAGTRLLTSTHVGLTAVDDFQSLPASLRYYAGGDRSIRGFDFESLGPRDSRGQVIGGKHLLVGTIELEKTLTDPFRIAVFVDAGNALNEITDLEKELAIGAGIGARLATPIGMVRVDLAYPLTDTDSEKLRIHFTVGPDL